MSGTFWLILGTLSFTIAGVILGVHLGSAWTVKYLLRERIFEYGNYTYNIQVYGPRGSKK